MEVEIKKALKDWPQIIKPYKKANHLKAFGQILNTFGPFLGLWVLTYYSLNWSYWLTFPLVIINAFLLVRIFIIQHDCGHQSFFASKQWNDLLGWICSFFSSIPYDYWARVHSYHHGHTGQLEHRSIGDINFLTVEEYRNSSTFGRLAYRTFRHPLILFFVAPFVYLAINNRYSKVGFKGWERTHIRMHFNNILIVLFYALMGYLLGWKALLLVHLPMVYFFGVIAFWFFYVQHQHEHTYMQWTDDWDFLTAAIKGSTFYKLPWIFNWLTGNIGYHHIHHLSSRIPNYHLVQCAEENPILQRYVKEINFVESLPMVFNKLWCERQERMITFREFYRLEGKK